jgi:selenide,water dikinase
VRPLAEAGLVPGGTRRNLEDVAPSTSFEASLGEIERLILSDAQTSGGLLIAVAPEKQTQLLAELERHETLARAVVGEVIEAEAGQLEVVAGDRL